VPGALEIVALGDRYVEQGFDSLHVFGLHLAQIVEERKFSQSGHECVALQLEVKEAHNADRVLESVQALFDDLHVVRVLQRPGDAGQQRYPSHLKHGPNVDEVRSAVELVAHLRALTLRAHQGLEQSLFIYARWEIQVVENATRLTSVLLAIPLD
jgi:hypothetical protein